MSTKIPLAELLRWRLAQAEAQAPPPPRAAELLALARPWWEKWPEQFQTFVERLGKMQIAYGHAMAEPGLSRVIHPVSTLILQSVDQLETSARVLYIEVRDGRLRLRFQLDTASAPDQNMFEVTFICDASSQPLFVAEAARSVHTEYRLEAELPDDVARKWASLRVTDRMPFRFILRPLDGHV
jgi:hypothetical protein